METLYTAPSGTAFGGIGYTRRHIIAASSLLASATSVRVGFQHLLSTTYTITDAYIGLQAVSGDAYDIDPATLVRLTQGGNTTLTITNTAYYSDAVSLAVDGSRAVIISLYGGTGQLYWAGALPSGYTAHYRSGNYAGVDDATSFSASPSNVVGFLTLEGELVSLFGPISIEEQVDDINLPSSTWNVGKAGVAEPSDDVEVFGFIDVSFVGVAEYLDDAVLSGYIPLTGIVNLAEEADLIALSSLSEAGASECIVVVAEPLDKVSSVGANTADRVMLTEAVDDTGIAAVTWNAGIITILEYRDEVMVYAASGETRGPLTVHEALDGVAVPAYTSNVGRVVASCGVDGVAVATEETAQAGSAIMAVTDPVDLIAIQTTTCIGAVAHLEVPLDSVSLRAASGMYGVIALDDPMDQIKLLSLAAAGGIPLFEFTRPVADMGGDLPAPSPATVLHFNRTVPALGVLAEGTAAVEPFHFSR